MFGELFLPDAHALIFEEIEIKANAILVRVVSAGKEAVCPYCQMTATRMHSHYCRTLDDLPCGERRVQLQWKAKRFFCDNYACSHYTFCERLPEVAEFYARKTKRLQQKQIQIGYQVGGEAGKRLAKLLNMSISGDQILRFVRSKAEPAYPTPRVLGVDDWAIRKGQTYGTILVDLEKQQVIDLLPDRKPETLAAWLLEHPGIEIISRDRGKEYIEGIALANHEFIEVADRFHLLKNMVEMLQRLFERCPVELALAAKKNSSEQIATSPAKGSKEHDELEPEKDKNETSQEDKKTYRQVRFEEVKALAEQGLSQRAIASKTGLARPTVRKYLLVDKPPQKRQTTGSGSKTVPFMDFIRQRWNQNNPSVKQLFEELRAQGFTGSYTSLNRAIHNQMGVQNLKKSRTPAQKSIRYSPRQAAWAVFQPDQKLKDWQKTLCQTLCALSPLAENARRLAHTFREMISNRQHDCLDDWLLQAESSQIVEFVRFAASLRSDYKAIKAALTYSWSNGQVEGQVNRLKLIKRQMYGRAGFLLLRKRVLGPAPVS